MNKIKLAQQLFSKAFTDAELINNVVGVVGDIICQKFPDDSKLGIFYSIGDVREIRGFYTDQWLIDDMTASMMGRAFRMCALQVGVDLTSPTIATQLIEVMMQTDDQQHRIVPLIIQRCIRKYGQPETVDHSKLFEIKKRYGVVNNMH